jgi:DNA-binding response OmpR family regulator
MPKVLLVEDDLAVSKIVQDTLLQYHFAIDALHDGLSANAGLETYQYDLIILDWDLPGMSGIDIATAVRRRGIATPILMLTGKAQISDKGKGFDAGADDYLTKPFDPRELVMRVKSLLRRPAQLSDTQLRVGEVTLDPEKFIATKNGQDLELARREFQLLEFLMRHPNQVFSAEALLDRVWTLDSDASVDAIRGCVVRLRKKLDKGGKSSLLQNIYGLGYKISTDAAE